MTGRKPRKSSPILRGLSARATEAIRWIHENCCVPEGRDVGKPLILRPWQQRELEKIYGNPHGTRRAILSFGRKNGKTCLSACLLLLHLCGPETEENSQLYSAAQSRDQAALLYRLAAKIVRMSPILRRLVTLRDTIKEMSCQTFGTVYRALSAEASTAYGLSPVFIVHDELGQVRGPRSELYEALETATGAQEHPLSIIISTQAPHDADLLSVLIEDAKTGYDPRVVLSLYTAEREADPFAEETIKKANPAYGDFLNAAEVRAMADDARRMSSREAEYRNLILNQRVQSDSPFVSPAVWKACNTKPKSITDVPVYGGLDLSAISDLTALVLVGAVENVLQVESTFWLPAHGLADKALKDQVPYDQWEKEGHLIAIPGKVVDYEYVSAHLYRMFETYNVQKIAFDRWNFTQLRPSLLRAGFSEYAIDNHFVEFGQGFKDMAPALRALEGELLSGHIAHGGHPVLGMCAANAVVQTDPAGNRKLTKAKSHGRIDGMIALAMAIGIMPLGVQSRPVEFEEGFEHTIGKLSAAEIRYW